MEDVRVKLILDDELNTQFVEAGKKAQTEAQKVQDSINGIGRSSNSAGASIQAFEGNSRQSLRRTAGDFQQLALGVREFGDNAIRGNLGGAMVSFTRLAVDGFKTVGVEAALATGGISLAVGAIILLIQKAIESNKELEEAQRRANDAMVKLDQIMAEQIQDQTEQAIEKRIQTGEKYYDEALAAGNEEVAVYKLKLDKMGHFSALWSDERIADYYWYTNKVEQLETELSEKLKTINEKTNSDIKKIREDATNKDNPKPEKPTRAEDIDLDKIGEEIDAFVAERDAKARQANVAELDRISKNLQETLNANEAKKKASDELAMKELENAKMIELSEAQSIASITGALVSLNQIHKGNAKVSQGLAIAETIMNTAVAVMKATAQTGVLAPLVVPSIIAAGAAQIAVISAQKFARGGDFVTSGPQAIIVGDNPGGRERVQVTPISSPNYNGPGGGTNITIGDVIIKGNADNSTVKAINISREKQLRDLREMIKELQYARQI